jgi:phosphoenolpyruvate carboxylase
MESIAVESMRAYRALIDDPAFWNWFTQVSPFPHISGLPIGSRPAARGKRVDFENLRAIPWVFTWTQMRYNVPGWYGIGSGLHAAGKSGAGQADRLRTLYQEWATFRTFVDNAQQEMARARLAIAALYAEAEPGEFHERIAAEFARAEAAILAITGQTALLDNSPVIQRSIAARNPATDVLNLIQIELIRRFRNASETEQPALRAALFASINGIAAAMQSTG